MLGRPHPANNPEVSRSFFQYIAALHLHHGTYPDSWVQPRLRECCVLTGLSLQTVRTLFKFYNIVPKRPVQLRDLSRETGPVSDFYGDPDSITMSKQMLSRREAIRDTHMREWAKAMENCSKRKKPSWDDRIPGESLEEYRLRLDAGDPKEIARDRERARKFKARVAARLAAQGKVVPCHKI